jgi:hypothetical protein
MLEFAQAQINKKKYNTLRILPLLKRMRKNEHKSYNGRQP